MLILASLLNSPHQFAAFKVTTSLLPALAGVVGPATAVLHCCAGGGALGGGTQSGRAGHLRTAAALPASQGHRCVRTASRRLFGGLSLTLGALVMTKLHRQHCVEPCTGEAGRQADVTSDNAAR